MGGEDGKRERQKEYGKARALEGDVAHARALAQLLRHIFIAVTARAPLCVLKIWFTFEGTRNGT